MRITRPSQGFTLVEIMVVMVLLVVGLMALLASQGAMLGAAVFNKERAIALSAARAVMEEVCESPYDDIVPGNFNPTFDADVDGNALNTLLGENAVGRLQITGPDASNVKTITVEVLWRGHGDKPRQVRLATEVADRL